MDPPPAVDSGQHASGRGVKKARRLGMKDGATPSPARTSSIARPLVRPPAPSSSPTATTSSPTAPTSSSDAPTASPAAPTPRTAMAPGPPQGAGWGSMPSNISAFPGNQGSNLWMQRPHYPVGGFLNMMNQPHYPPQPQVQEDNFHLVGQSMTFNQMSSPASGIQHDVNQGTSTNKPVHIDIEKEDNSEANKKGKKRYWTHEEEERLASAWLEASKDSIHGNDKKGDTFWKEVTAEFNRKGNGKPTREFNQLKIHWSRLKSMIGDWNDYWSKVTQIYTSGYSDDMLKEEAQKMYANKFGKRFQLVHWWKILKKEPKWNALFDTEKEKTEVIEVPDEQKRPIGREAAKAERNGKRKKGNVMEGIVLLGDTVDKMVKINQDRQVQLEKVTGAQKEISNVNLKVAMEEKEGKMYQVYNTLLSKDTSTMSEEQKANHERALHKIEERLFAD